MTGERDHPIGILAGNGAVPAEVAAAIRRSGRQVHIVKIDGDTDGALAGLPVVGKGWGQVGGIFESFRSAGCRELLFVGSVRRPDLMRLWPDLGFFRYLPELLGLVFAGGDDGLARVGIRFVERRGFTVVGIADVAPEILLPAGPLGQVAPAAADVADILLGSAVVRALGRHDIGQAVVVTGGRIEAIEGAEGTDRMLEQVARRRALPVDAGASQDPRDASVATGLRGVVVKRPKPGQELRIDIPAIGPRTAERAHAAGLGGIAVLAGLTLAADRPGLARTADRHGLFVYGFTEGDGDPGQVARGDMRAGGQSGPDRDAEGPTAVLSRTRPSAVDLSDSRRGCDAVATLASFGPEGAAVVVNGYVIGLEPSMDVDGLLERTRDIRPWGITRWRRRSGVLVISRSHLGTPRAGARLATVAAGARLAAISVRAGGLPESAPSGSPMSPHLVEAELADLVGIADRTGLAVIRVG